MKGKKLIEINKIHNANCLDIMKEIPDKSIHMILCDLPYGTSASSWDKKLPMDKLWYEYERIIMPNRAIVLFAQQPFTSLLIASNINLWKYNWIWEKDNGTNFLNSHYCPLKITEDICVFGDGATSYVKKGENLIYNPQFTEGKPYTIKSGQQKGDSAVVRSGTGGREDIGGYVTESDGKRYPKNLIKFNRDKEKLHPTQKPVALCEFLIRTYSNEGEIILDNCAGSFTTAVACDNTNRNWFCIEKEFSYCNVGLNRVNENRERLNILKSCIA
jgi:site-specific DNA-methyltransferase (adenine-specific)